ncbi:MAG: N-6 DNA methylase [Rhodospirillales bacterium]|nr:N-6 DNA methylase [Rhodospirillales bacterium]
MDLDWSEFDFAHIPVGVLSQVYESFSHRADPRTARDTSVHYTPRTIASLMVDEAFAPLKNKGTAKVLDPSCGAGIFLVLAFRRLVREAWKGDERPKTKEIQDILYGQVRGFDISESALRLAALGLYITAIELNGSPRPPQALKFPRNLRNEVLYRFGKDESHDAKPNAFPLGSLGPEVSPDFEGTCDIVIGNPPWTRLRDEKDNDDDNEAEKERNGSTDTLNKEFTAIGRRVLKSRGLVDLAKRFQNPDKNPDLPFLWRALEWAKPGGVIALAMPARLFGRTTGKGFEAWRAVLRSVEVTGLINGADLRWSSVWRDVKMPFCIFFARNTRPGPDHRFYYATPLNEPDLNAEGRFRIDYEAAHSISAGRVERQPWLLKTLSLGTWLDVEVMEGLTNPDLKTLIDRWLEWDEAGNQTGEGYNRAPRTEVGPGSPQKWVKFLAKLPIFKVPEQGYGIEYSALATYGDTYGTNENGEASANKPRRAELFQSPLVIVPRAPGDSEIAPRAYIATKPVAFSKSFYGYSCAGHPDAETLAALVFLLAHCTLFRYFGLMVSVSLGADRMLLTKQDFDSLPFPDLKALPTVKKTAIRNLAHRLQHEEQKPWQEINEFVFSLYGLDADAVQVTTDTLFAAASYRKAGRAALERTKRDTRACFITTLRDELEPFLDEAVMSLDRDNLPTPVENEFLASMLAWERAPILPISKWFEPELTLPHPDSLSVQELHEVLWSTIRKLFSKRIVLDFTDHLNDRHALLPDRPRTSCRRRRKSSSCRGTICTGTVSTSSLNPRRGSPTTPRTKSAKSGPKKWASHCRRNCPLRIRVVCRVAPHNSYAARLASAKFK